MLLNKIATNALSSTTILKWSSEEAENSHKLNTLNDFPEQRELRLQYIELDQD